MKLLEDRILRDGQVRPGNVLKVDCFLNHQIDVMFLCELGKEFKRLFSDSNITKIKSARSFTAFLRMTE